MKFLQNISRLFGATNQLNLSIMKQFIRVCLLAMVGVLLNMTANAQGFEGVITMQMEVPQLGPDKVPMVVTSKGDKSVMEMTVPQQGTMSVYTNRATKKMVMVMAAMKMGFEIDMNKPGIAAKADEVKQMPKATGQKKMIAGYNCELYTLDPKDGSQVEMWMTGDLPKTLSMAVGSAIGGLGTMNKGGAGNGGASGGFDDILAKGLVPIEFDAKSDGKVMATIQFVKYEQKSIADSFMEVPSGINIQQMPDMGKMGGRH